MNTKIETNKHLLWIATIVVLVVISGLTYHILHQQRKVDGITKQVDEMVWGNELRKVALTKESDRIISMYGTLMQTVRSDSLHSVLVATNHEELVKLREELRTVKPTDILQINKLDKELGVLCNDMHNIILRMNSLEREEE